MLRGVLYLNRISSGPYRRKSAALYIYALQRPNDAARLSEKQASQMRILARRLARLDA